MAESNEPAGPNEIDLLTRRYLTEVATRSAKSNRDVQRFSREARSGWHTSELERAIHNFHTRWLGAREVAHG